MNKWITTILTFLLIVSTASGFVGLQNESNSENQTNNTPIYTASELVLKQKIVSINIDAAKDESTIRETLLFRNTNFLGEIKNEVTNPIGLTLTKVDMIMGGSPMPMYMSNEGNFVVWQDVIDSVQPLYNLEYTTSKQATISVASPEWLIMTISPIENLYFTDENGKQITSTPVIENDYATYRWENPTFTQLNIGMAPVAYTNPLLYLVIAIVLLASLIYQISKYRVPIRAYVTKINIRMNIEKFNDFMTKRINSIWSRTPLK